MAKEGKPSRIQKPAKATRARTARVKVSSSKAAPGVLPKQAPKRTPKQAPKKTSVAAPETKTVRGSKTPAADAAVLWGAYFRAAAGVPQTAARNALMEFYLPVVRFHADRLRARLPDGVDVDDLISAGVFGLEKAIRSFDPARGFKFETFASPRIHGEILDSLRAMDWVPRLVRSRSAKVDAAVRRHEMAHGRKPTEVELAQSLGICDAEEFARVRRDSSAAAVGSIDRKWSEQDSGRETCDAEVLVDQGEANPASQAARRDLKALLMRGLTRSEKLIVALYYWEQMTMKEIGKVLDLSESRVSQMHASILGRLKAQLGSRAEELGM